MSNPTVTVQQQPKRTNRPLFTPDVLITLNTHIKKKKEVKVKDFKKKIEKLKLNTINLNPTLDFTIKDNEYSNNSIQSFIDNCHKDIRQLFHNNEVLSYKATVDGLIVTFSDKSVMVIESLINKKKHYKLIQKKVVLLDIVG